MDINEKLLNYISKSMAGKTLTADDDLFESGVVHSLFAMQLVLFIEKEFDVELDDDDLNFESLRTVRHIGQLVERNWKGA